MLNQVGGGGRREWGALVYFSKLCSDLIDFLVIKYVCVRPSEGSCLS